MKTPDSNKLVSMLIDVWSYRMIIGSLCAISTSVTVGGISLAAQEKKIPEQLIYLATGCNGALIGLLAPTPKS
ncbi:MULTISPECIES: hypothetical protein [unclassified Microcoleus]|uniref:hypothetical protein n=1 Tax=unclassified Microcoleus TaxID=2642155 RepID=UPI002FD69BC5